MDLKVFLKGLDGVFDRIHARTVPRQSPPYPSLAEVAAIQTESTFTDLEATVVGFRFPAAADGIEVTGTHLHFVSADRRCAGHILSCDVRSGRLALAAVTSLRIELPAGVELPAVTTTTVASAGPPLTEIPAVSAIPSQFGQLGRRAVPQLALGAGHSLQAVVVEDHGLAVGRQVHVQLNAVTGLAGGLEGGHARTRY